MVEEEVGGRREGAVASRSEPGQRSWTRNKGGGLRGGNTLFPGRRAWSGTEGKGLILSLESLSLVSLDWPIVSPDGFASRGEMRARLRDRGKWFPNLSGCFLAAADSRPSGPPSAAPGFAGGYRTRRGANLSSPPGSLQ